MPPVMLQIRNLPDDLHRRLKVRAAQEGVSMSDWVTARIEEALERPPRDEVLRRLAALDPVDVDPSALLRQLRGPLLAAEDPGAWAEDPAGPGTADGDGP